MKVLSIFLTLLLLSATAFAQKHTPIDAESKVQFVIKNFGLKVDGQLKGIKGSISFDPSALNNSLFNVTVNSTTINTGINARDKHLRKADYFDVEKFPLISFVSTKISKASTAGKYTVSGNLTIKGTTKPIEFDFTAIPSNTGFIFKGAFSINRRDYKVGGNSLSLSDNLTVELDIMANKN
jgi:polyisoprenoid-binding protein YceI